MERRVQLARNKRATALEAYEAKRWDVVGDEALKAVEEASEAHAASLGRRLGSHESRLEFARVNYGKEFADALRDLFRVYEELGYDGSDGTKSTRARNLMENLLEEVGRKIGVNFAEP